MLGKKKFFDMLLAIRKETMAANGRVETILDIDRTDVGFIEVRNYSDCTYIQTGLSKELYNLSTELLIALRRIVLRAYQPERHPDVSQYITVYNLPVSAMSLDREIKPYGGEYTDVPVTIRIREKTLVSLMAANMLDKIEGVFGKGTVDKPRKVRDRRHNTIWAEKSIPKMQDELLMAVSSPKEISIYIDTSGSMGFHETMLAYAVQELMKQRYPYSEIHCHTFSDDVLAVKDMSWDNVEGVNNGGTQLYPLIKHIKDNSRKINIVVGDMMFAELGSEDHVPSLLPEDIVWVATDNVERPIFEQLNGNPELCFTPPTEQ